MPVISTLLRRQIDTAAYALVAVSEKLRPAFPELADVYRALGQGLDSSHLKFQGSHRLDFNLPAGCQISLSGTDFVTVAGPIALSLQVAGS